MKKIKANWVIALPFGVSVSVKKGDKVVKGDVLYQENLEKIEIVSLGKELAGISNSKIVEINGLFGGKTINRGEVIYQSTGIFKKQILAPTDGTFKLIDEWNNLHIIVGTNSRKFLSPTEAVVGLVKEDELVLEFSAYEYTGKGLNDNRGWVSDGIITINRASEINYGCEDKLILVKEINETLLIRADVVGVGAVVVLEDENIKDDVRINFKMPAVCLTGEMFRELENKAGSGIRTLVNGSSGRLLMVVSNNNDN